MKNLERKVIAGTIVGLVCYAVIAVYADLDSLAGALGAFAWSHFAAALALATANYMLRFVKWEVFLRKLDIRIPLGRSALIFTAGFVMSVTPGKMGEVFKSVLLRQTDGVPVARTAPVVLAERVTDFLALILLASLGIGTYQYGTGALVAVLGATTLGILLLRWPKLILAILDQLKKVPVVSKIEPKLREAYSSTQVLLSPGSLAAMTALSTVSWGLECVAFWYIAHGFADTPVTMDLLGGTFVFSITTILGAVSFMPGGLGVAEVGMIGAVDVLGMIESETVASATAVLTRLCTLWWAVFCGFVAYGLFLKRYPAKSSQENLALAEQASGPDVESTSD